MRIRFEPSVISNNYAVAFIEGTNLFLRQVNYLSNATTIEVIYSENFRQCVFPVPPIEEQQAIAAWLRNPNMPVNAAINAYARQLTLLAEYRAALIHECVTGQRLVPDRQTPAEATAHAL
jgi:type I restriction enzyme S subunit